MQIQIVILQGLAAALCLVWTSELQLCEHLSVKLVDLAWGLSKLLATTAVFTLKVGLLSTLVTNDILARLALHGVDNDVAALGTDQVFVQLRCIRQDRRELILALCLQETARDAEEASLKVRLGILY